MVLLPVGGLWGQQAEGVPRDSTPSLTSASGCLQLTGIFSHWDT